MQFGLLTILPQYPWIQVIYSFWFPSLRSCFLSEQRNQVPIMCPSQGLQCLLFDPAHTQKDTGVSFTVWREQSTVCVGNRSVGQEGSIQSLTSKMVFIHREQAKLTVPCLVSRVDLHCFKTFQILMH